MRKTYAAWGIDYLKYDWCSARNIYNDEEMQAVYQKMGDALRKTGRPIVYSLCQYGRADVWKWGPEVGGNLWRTTGDIRDNWDSMTKIGFSQNRSRAVCRARPLERSRHAGDRQWRHDRRRIPDAHEPVVDAGGAADRGQRLADRIERGLSAGIRREAHFTRLSAKRQIRSWSRPCAAL